MPNQTALYDHIKSNAKHARDMVKADSRKGSVVICGAGPSLSEYPGASFSTREIWACNSALPYLLSRGLRVTHGFTIDQGEDMLKDWSVLPDVKYLVASSVHPKLARGLAKKKRRVSYFHSYLGIPEPEGFEGCYEMHLYTSLYPTSVQVGHGLNSVPRAVCLAIAMGFESITVYGADCACAPNQPLMPEYQTREYADWINSLPLYADGRTAGECFGTDAVLAEAPDIDGKRWHTRPDMVISARHLLDLEKSYPNRITLVGDTLPNALRGKDESFNSRLPELTGVGVVSGFGAAEAA